MDGKDTALVETVFPETPRITNTSIAGPSYELENILPVETLYRLLLVTSSP